MSDRPEGIAPLTVAGPPRSRRPSDRKGRASSLWQTSLRPGRAVGAVPDRDRSGDLSMTWLAEKGGVDRPVREQGQGRPRADVLHRGEVFEARRFGFGGGKNTGGGNGKDGGDLHEERGLGRRPERVGSNGMRSIRVKPRLSPTWNGNGVAGVNDDGTIMATMIGSHPRFGKTGLLVSFSYQIAEVAPRR